MADEKVIRISAQDTGFGQQINRMAEDAKKALSGIGLDGLFDQADKQFDKVQDKIKAISEELKKVSAKASEDFDSKRAAGGGNDFYKKGIDREQNDYNTRSDKAEQSFNKFSDAVRKKMGGDDGGSGDSLNNSRNPAGDVLSKAFGKIGRGLGQGADRIIPGAGNILGGLGESGGSALGGAVGGGMAGGALAAGAIAGVVVAVFAAVKMLYGKGMDDWRTESKVSATFDIDRDTFGRGGNGGKGGASDFGLDNKEYKEFILSVAKSRGSATNVEEVAYNQMTMQKAYGLSGQEASKFNSFNFQDVSKRDSGTIIADILNRSEKQGILGVSGRDFSRLPEKLEQVGSIMSMQKASGETADSNTAIDLLMAGQKIGGRFGDDRASESFGRINESIKSPDNPGMKAYMYEMLRKANPDASYTDIQAKMENGASKENLQAILPEINKMPKGEARRMAYYKLTKNMQDAIRLDNSDGGDSIVDSLSQSSSSNEDIKKKFNDSKGRMEKNLAATDELYKVIGNALTDFGEKYVARPFNDFLRGVGQGNSTDIMKMFTMPAFFLSGAYDGNSGKGNAVTGKPKDN